LEFPISGLLLVPDRARQRRLVDMQAFGSAGELEFFGNSQKAAKMSQLHISPSLLITEASTASGTTCFELSRLTS
jgi:hypothetical protein